MPHARLRWFWIIVFVGTLTTRSAAFPIPHQSLQRLVVQSDLIVVAEVMEFTRASSDNTRSTEYRLKPLKTLGGLAPPSILVHYRTPLEGLTPTPVDPGETVLAFLIEDGDHYQPVGLSQGMKPLEQAAVEVHSERVTERLRIQATRDSSERLTQVVEWLVTCVEHPATRPDALTELASDAEGQRGTAESNPSRSTYCARLTQHQQARLFAQQRSLARESDPSAWKLIPILAVASQRPALLAIAEQVRQLPSPAAPASRDRVVPARTNDTRDERFDGPTAGDDMDDLFFGPLDDTPEEDDPFGGEDDDPFADPFDERVEDLFGEPIEDDDPFSGPHPGAPDEAREAYEARRRQLLDAFLHEYRRQ